jgi:hypothetical protein
MASWGATWNTNPADTRASCVCVSRVSHAHRHTHEENARSGCLWLDVSLPSGNGFQYWKPKHTKHGPYLEGMGLSIYTLNNNNAHYFSRSVLSVIGSSISLVCPIRIGGCEQCVRQLVSSRQKAAELCNNEPPQHGLMWSAANKVANASCVAAAILPVAICL